MKYVKSGGNEKYRYSKVYNSILDFFCMKTVVPEEFYDDSEDEIKNSS